MDKVTSDEKLLKILESTSPVKHTPKVGMKPKDNFKFRFSVPKKFDFKAKINFININKLLIIIGIILTICFLYILVMGPKRNASSLALGLKADSSFSKLSSHAIESFLEKNEYLKQISKRNLFVPSGQQASGSEAVEISKLIEELSKDLKLVAIIWSDNPEVMIESAKENRTFLLKKQDVFGVGQYKVKTILRNSVILDVPSGEGSKEFELR